MRSIIVIEKYSFLTSPSLILKPGRLKYVKMGLEKGPPLREAVNAAVKHAIDEELLDGYFRTHEGSVVRMILAEYDEEKVMRHLKEDAYEDG